jgi:transposase
MNDSDGIRIEGFRQMRQEIRGSQDYLVVGIDVAKEKHTAFFGTATGKALLRRFVFTNDRDGFEWLVLQAEGLEAQHDLKKVVFGMEPTANYHKPLGEYLIQRGELVVLVSGLAVKHNREMLDGRWDKNDTKDPANVADLICQGKCMFYEYPDEKLRELRSLLSLKRRLKKQEHSLRMRIRNHLVAQYFPEFDRVFDGSRSVDLAIVKWCFPPRKIEALDYAEFVDLVAPRLRGLHQEQRLRNIWEKAADSIGCEANEAVEFEAGLLVDRLRKTKEVMGQSDGLIKGICQKFEEYEHLLSIPGFGPDVSSKVLGAIGNPFRFETHKQVLKLAGLDLSADRSGKRSDTVTPVISKRGKKDLRYALYQAALVASSRNRPCSIWFTHQLRGREREKGIKTKLRVKLSAKLLKIAWTLMKKKEPFDPDYLRIQ